LGARLKRAAKKARGIAQRREQSSAAPAPRPQAVFLVGFMGAGKTCVGETLAARLGWLFIDLDGRIESRQERRIGDIFRQSGEGEFRRLEREELLRLVGELESSGQAAVVSLGGGTFVQPDNFTCLQNCGYTVFLDAPVEELWRRAQIAEATRPLAISENHFRQLYAARHSGYMKADYCVQTGDRKVEEVAEEIMELLRGTVQGEQR